MGILLIGNDTHRIVYMPGVHTIVFEQKGYDSLGADVWRKERELLPEYTTPGGVMRRVVVFDYLLELYHTHIAPQDQVIIPDNRLLEA